MDLKILQLADGQKINAFEKSNLLNLGLSEEEVMFASWNSSWREEALNHYIPQGWSFGLFDQEQNLLGYYLAQPLLFYKTITQTLWIERLSFKEVHVGAMLLQTAYSLTREKMLQKLQVYNYQEFNQNIFQQDFFIKIKSKIKKYPENSMLEILTSKIKDESV